MDHPTKGLAGGANNMGVALQAMDDLASAIERAKAVVVLENEGTFRY